VAGGIVVWIKQVKVVADLQSRYKVRFLEVRAEVAVFRDVCKKLKRHEDIFISGHGGEDAGRGGGTVHGKAS
jgi:hypothetical protein